MDPIGPIANGVASTIKVLELSFQLRAVGEQTTDLLKTVGHVDRNVREARRLLRLARPPATVSSPKSGASSSTSSFLYFTPRKGPATERDWMERQVRDCEDALRDIQRLVEPARVNAATLSSIKTKNKFLWVLRDGPIVREKRDRLQICCQTLNTVLVILQGRGVGNDTDQKEDNDEGEGCEGEGCEGEVSGDADTSTKQRIVQDTQSQQLSPEVKDFETLLNWRKTRRSSILSSSASSISSSATTSRGLRRFTSDPAIQSPFSPATSTSTSSSTQRTGKGMSLPPLPTLPPLTAPESMIPWAGGVYVPYRSSLSPSSTMSDPCPRIPELAGLIPEDFCAGGEGRGLELVSSAPLEVSTSSFSPLPLSAPDQNPSSFSKLSTKAHRDQDSATNPISHYQHDDLELDPNLDLDLSLNLKSLFSPLSDDSSPTSLPLPLPSDNTIPQPLAPDPTTTKSHSPQAQDIGEPPAAATTSAAAAVAEEGGVGGGAHAAQRSMSAPSPSYGTYLRTRGRRWLAGYAGASRKTGMGE